LSNTIATGLLFTFSSGPYIPLIGDGIPSFFSFTTSGTFSFDFFSYIF